MKKVNKFFYFLIIVVILLFLLFSVFICLFVLGKHKIYSDIVTFENFTESGDETEINISIEDSNESIIKYNIINNSEDQKIGYISVFKEVDYGCVKVERCPCGNGCDLNLTPIDMAETQEYEWDKKTQMCFLGKIIKFDAEPGKYRIVFSTLGEDRKQTNYYSEFEIK